MFIQGLTYPKKLALTRIIEASVRISVPGAKLTDQLLQAFALKEYQVQNT